MAQRSMDAFDAAAYGGDWPKTRARKPKIEYYWTWRMLCTPKGRQTKKVDPDSWRVNWRLFGGNGELMCSSNQGHRDKTDARRAVVQVANVLGGNLLLPVPNERIREVGPGKKPTPIGETK